jgi:tetratricopeptide (TPR) repeat protein
MSTPPTATATATSAPPDPTLVALMISRLRAEHDATESETTKAILLHEIGVLEELVGDEAAAARDHLAVVNAEPEFREPLERLMAIIERRQSYKNLGKLLERLVKVAEEPEERVRALQEQAAFLAEHEQDLAGARECLEAALKVKGEEASSWLALECIAGRLDDLQTRIRALTARSELSRHPTWRALLLVDLARVLLDQGDETQALEALQNAASQQSDAQFLVEQELEQLGHRQERDDLVASALEAQADLVMQAMSDAARGDALGVPRYRRNGTYAADALLRAADAHRKQGGLARATELLDQALTLLPGEPALVHARLGAADAAGDTATAAQLARQQLERGFKGSFAAALWLRIAEGAASEGDSPRALEAVRKALAEDPACVPARALLLDLLAHEQDPQALAAALEATAEQLSSEEAKARCYLLAADVWARLCGDRQGARAALSQAGMYGATPNVVARVARILATQVKDEAWFEEATRRLLAAGASDEEQCSLWFELGRARLLRGDVVGAGQAFASLANAAGGNWLGHALRAYAVPAAKPADDPAAASLTQADSLLALLDLARVESDPDTARALRLIVARRALLAGKTDEAQRHLSELHSDDSSDIVVATALAAVLRAGGHCRQAAEVLGACALASDDPLLQAALQFEAGMLFWAGGDRTAALDAFNAASTVAPAAGGALLGWALRAADPDGLEARRRALEAAADTAEPGVTELERFALELGANGDPDDARTALDSIESSAPTEIARAATLARALWSTAEAEVEVRLGALAQIGVLSPAAAVVARSAAFYTHLLDNSEPVILEDAAAQWAAADTSVPAALEWLGAAIAAGDVVRETQARDSLAQRLGPNLAWSIESTARLVGALASDEPPGSCTGVDEAARLTNLELALPGADPRRRAAALADASDCLSEDAKPALEALAGYNYLAHNDLQSAQLAFRRVAEAHPNEIIGWEGLRTVGEASKDRALVAEACAALGDAIRDDALGAELWEQAAMILLEELNDPSRAQFAFSRAVERDINRSAAFDRLFRIVRANKDHERLLELIEQRLGVAEDPAEIAKMFWERARVLRKQDKRKEALAALENVTMFEPDHVGALALSGEIYITESKFAEAADALARLATREEAPRQQRLMSGVAAADLLENKLDQPRKALEVLAELYRSGLSTLPVRERLARSAAKLEDWDQALEVLEELMIERETSEARMEAARLAIAIRRESLGQPATAEAAVRQLLKESPDDGEGLDLLLTGILPDSSTEQLLNAGRDALIAHLVDDPLQPERVDRLARIAAFLGSPALRQAALGALVALGQGTPEVDQELSVLDERVTHLPQIAIDEDTLPDLCDPDDVGAIPELMATLATTFADALGPGLGALGVTKRERVDPRAGLPVRNEIAAWAGALGVGEFDLYVGGRDEQGVVAVATERPALVIGPGVAAPLSPLHRQAVARELFALSRGTTILRHREHPDIAALVVASCRLGGHELPAPHYALLDEFQRLLGKQMPRKVKKVLPELAARVVEEQADPIRWARAATSSLDRLAAVAAGDVSHVLAAHSGLRGQLGVSDEARRRAARLLSFVLSPTYLAVREQLGMGVR